jgi:hypothetical protein
MRASGENARVTSAYRILKRSAVSTEVPTTGLAEPRGKPT